MSLFTKAGNSATVAKTPSRTTVRTPHASKVVTTPKVKAPTPAQLEAQRRREEQKAKIQAQDIRCGAEDGILWIECPVKIEQSKKGNSLLVASSHGFFETDVVINGEKVTLTFNAIIPNKG